MNTVTATLPLFEPVTAENILRYRALSLAENTQNSDFSAVNVSCWNDTYPQRIAFLGERAAVRLQEPDGGLYYLPPVGTGALAPAMEALAADAAANGVPFRLVGVTKTQLQAIAALYGAGAFDVSASRDYADYLYDAAALCTLSGKKLHAKRNHINAFTAAHDWAVSPLTAADFDACRAILAAWDGQHAGASVQAEHLAIGHALDLFSVLGLSGALLTADGAAVAFAIGEKIAEDTFCVHFEKTLPDFDTAYAVINREFARMICAADPAVRFINREEDMGLDNLRAAKLSYHPAEMVEKHTLLFHS